GCSIRGQFSSSENGIVTGRSSSVSPSPELSSPGGGEELEVRSEAQELNAGRSNSQFDLMG
ncbi:hypothetical protein LINPERPRIM_LOCUS34645, partial [Linum perenne]